MHIALYFGSFNPIHNGHVGLANHLIDQGLADAVWFVLSPQNPLKESHILLDDDTRLNMTKLATAQNNAFAVSDIEFSMPKPNYTIYTLRRLKEQFPEHLFTLLIGADNMEIFNKWKDYQSILNEFQVMVYPRSGFNFEKPKYPEMKLIQAPLFELSSSEVRENIKNGFPYAHLIPQSVANYIEEHRLYR